MKQLLLWLAVGLVSPIYSQTDYTFVYDNAAIIANGSSFHDAEKFDEAIAQYDKIVQNDPLYLTAQYEKALTLAAMKKPDDESALLHGLHEKGLFTEMPSLYVLYGSCLSDLKKFDEAEKIFTEGEKVIPNSGSLLYNFALMYVRKEQLQKAVDYLQKTIAIAPYHTSAHYLLGLIAFENGKITEGTLALMTYLLLEPESSRAGEAIRELNQKFGQNYLDKPKVILSKSGDHFDDLETILRNQLPLKPAYKVQSDFDDIIIRQIQAISEYVAKDHKMENGFFETTYIPWVKDMMEQKQFEAFTYYMLESKKEALGKKLTSKKKMVEAFNENFIIKRLVNAFSKRTMDHFGKFQEVTVLYKNNYPMLIGPVKDGVSDGRFKLLNADGFVIGDINIVKDELDGPQKYYNAKGQLVKENNYVHGKLNGLEKEYYENGNLSVTANYKDSEYDGLATTYYLNGGKNCDVNYKNGKLDGITACYYQNGSKKVESFYKDGNLEGKYTYYNAVGDITETSSYKNGKLDGQYFEYYDGKTVKTEALYANGSVKNSYKTYYANSLPSRDIVYENGKIKVSTQYNSAGKKQSVNLYNSKEELEGIDYYDPAGNLFFQEKLRSEDLKKSLQYLKSSPKPIEVNTDKKTFTIKDFDGQLMSTGGFEKNKKTKEWRYYNGYGSLKSTEHYSENLLDGLDYNYETNGDVSSIVNYKNDTISGVYENYDHGRLRSISNYKGGSINGPYKRFYADGKVVNESYYSDGELNRDSYTFRQDGTLAVKTTYVDGVAKSVEYIDSSGKKDVVDYKNLNGKVTFTRNNFVMTTAEMKNGLYNGALVTKDKMNNKVAEGQYLNDMATGKATDYGPLSVPSSEVIYYCGKANGTARYYDLVGNVYLTNDYAFGDDSGKVIRYFHNKQKLFEHTTFDEAIDGPYTYFNQSGKPILIVNYENDEMKSYTRIGKSGELNETASIANGTVDIVSTYTNGKPAIKISYDKGSMKGKFQIFGEDGKTQYESNYIKGTLQGVRTEYFSNGNVYKKENFKDGDYEGAQEYYTEDGKLRLKANYKNDELHGNTEIYENGKLLLTKKYDSDELVGTTK
ncbi:tetratricopeptide repeat protein [Flavobacterium sp.]|uniref:tetratricopeptide repeat protein n=1 Tax=Flavobacterium sp. TaxID=239 RepID=UPI002613E367|nr:tetratricopeptide repeat protein [Flavobacterium sp.]